MSPNLLRAMIPAIVLACILSICFNYKWQENPDRKHEMPSKRLISITDTDGMKHYVDSRLIGPSGSSLLQDSEGHTVIFFNDEFHHGLNKTQCHKCVELNEH